MYVLFGVPGALDQLVPPSVDTCHWTVGIVPLAAARKVAVRPAFTDWLAGCVVTADGMVTFSVAAFVVAVPGPLVKIARYLLPLSPLTVAGVVYVVVVAPVTVVQVVPPSVDTCHWTVGEGVPDAPAVKVAVLPRITVWVAGCVVTTGLMPTVTVTVLTEVFDGIESVPLQRAL